MSKTNPVLWRYDLIMVKQVVFWASDIRLKDFAYHEYCDVHSHAHHTILPLKVCSWPIHQTSWLFVSTLVEYRFFTFLYWFSSQVGSYVDKTVLPVAVVVWRFHQRIWISFPPLLEHCKIGLMLWTSSFLEGRWVKYCYSFFFCRRIQLHRRAPLRYHSASVGHEPTATVIVTLRYVQKTMKCCGNNWKIERNNWVERLTTRNINDGRLLKKLKLNGAKLVRAEPMHIWEFARIVSIL